MAKAKTASKNSPTNRGAKISYFFQQKEVVPSLFIDFKEGKKYRCLQDKASGNLVFDQESGLPVAWDSKILTSK